MTPLYGTSPPLRPGLAPVCLHSTAPTSQHIHEKCSEKTTRALESAESTEGGVVGRADGDRLMYVDPDGSALPARAFVTCPNPDGSQGLAPFRKPDCYGAVAQSFAGVIDSHRRQLEPYHLSAETRIHPDNDGDCLAPFFTSFESRMVRSRDDRRGAQRGDSRAQNWFVFFVSYDSATAF
ncbi:hypothetical protein RHS01_04870 [Rhizoctonia solani]|uniref:Uncharacterized protein n=1 Tax=Rhizoctonia solani TaxID=456999 RepID=A0A8H7IEJ9_9AGAM|nr:hypothetical protein RHS01_04870 [Rhizoctonia solani]